jgi:DNA mismatch endonuclease (patch repair protein)
MRRIRGKDTKPEWIVRRLVYALGFRYRLHRKDLPGKPDLAFIGKRKVIFVHGCFWHQHQDPACKIARLPKSRPDYWLPKLERNRSRDEQHLSALREGGWESLLIWECEVKDEDVLAKRIRRFLKT